MRVLAAEDDPASRLILAAALRKAGHEVTLVSTGTDAWEVLRGDDPPPLVILDWMMPGMDGVEICLRLRARQPPRPTYVLLVTARAGREDVVAGLDAGADDYIVKPFDVEELRARVRVGVRVLDLQAALRLRIAELEEASSHVKQLRGLLPICSYCKKVRNDRDYWEQIETFVTRYSDARFSHGICPDCYEALAAEL